MVAAARYYHLTRELGNPELELVIIRHLAVVLELVLIAAAFRLPKLSLEMFARVR
jgi:hypothetical protein